MITQVSDYGNVAFIIIAAVLAFAQSFSSNKKYYEQQWLKMTLCFFL